MQQLLRHPEGVISTRTGFMGGENDNPTEENNGGHAEVVEVIFDPGRLSYRGLLEVFFQVHRADLDEGVVGSLYRSEIFYTSPEQRTVAEEMVRDVDASGHWPGKTVTRISEASVFWEMGLRTRTTSCGSRTAASPRSPGNTTSLANFSRSPRALVGSRALVGWPFG